ncbi:hypothetical protein P171DRAFT_518926 [Karstenula rhodostoma CBS 690.94]|uniref:ubiquitinyl hydrolase 1 n=1 Tax=Karstenula rhodostoma CBS 690.94 TaxID=1392251 RepID=A0A9P4UDJ4_9PLEO|nr:hypothetical protein P171DRAFT_518926 [Karstenula rhodostoma CBS 690.94]
MAANKRSTIEFLIRHTVLPPKLPPANDAEPADERVLLTCTIAALRELRNNISHAEPVLVQGFDSPISAIASLLDSRNVEGNIAEEQLVKSLRTLATTHDPAAVPLQVKAQNAGILIRRLEDNIVFEVFELSPKDEEVMTTKGRLVRCFPNHACSIHSNRLLEDGLMEALAHHIAKLSCTEVPEFSFGGGKTGTNYTASSTPTHPGLVTEYLVSVLSALGTATPTIHIQKHTREDVIFSSTGPPWRRSPLWLLIRVVLQLELSRSIDLPQLATAMYKAAIATILSTILDQANREQIDPELLHVSCVKLARRLRKMKSIPGDLYQICANPIQSILVGVHRKLDDSWSEAMDSTHPDIDTSVLSTLRLENDTVLNMTQLDRFLERIPSRKSQPQCSTFTPAAECPEFDDVELLFTLDDLDEGSEHRYFRLSVVEKWVKYHLSSWTEIHKYEKKSCLRLSRLIVEYHRAADCLYSDADSPSGLSLMYISIAELWIACDTCACAIYPILTEYSSEIDFSILQSLSLPFKSQMERLLAIENYIKAREKRADSNMPSLFRKFGHPQSFAARFFDMSNSLQDLRDRIERDATNKQQQKIEELGEKLKEYKNLISKSDELACNNHETVYRGRGRKRKAVDVSQKCRKCQLRAEAGNMRIEVHEWPLNSSEPLAKATVFEVHVPESYSYWRDATIYLLKDVLLSAAAKDTTSKDLHTVQVRASSYTLDNYDGLSSFRKRPEKQRLGIFSRKQPALGTSKYIMDGVMLLTDADVCVENDLPYRYYDSIDNLSMVKLQPTLKVQKKCTYQAPSRTPQLQRYLRTNNQADDATPNSVMASVSECPRHLSLDEYKCLSLLPLGNKIKYMNILTQLRAPVVDFTKAEAHCVVYQIIHMAGPPQDHGNDPVRASARQGHSILHDEAFCRVLLQELNATLQKTQSNWETWRALAICVLLALRILAFTEAPEIRSQCFDFLAAARQIAVSWTDALELRLRTMKDNAQRAELSCRKTEVALLCIGTCDMELAHMDDLLNSPTAVSTLLRMSIVIRESNDTISSDHGSLFRATLQTWRALLHRLSPMLRDGITSGRLEPNLNSAVTAAWANFEPRGSWNVLAEPKHHWAHIKSGLLDVHFNLLTAELLVNGLPLARLPDEYTEHETYIALFKGLSIEVMPTNEPGMDFSAKHTLHGYQLSFGMNKKRDHMQVVAARGDEKLDLVPRHVFREILSDTFVYEYFHWYSHDTGSIEFRPLDKPWIPSDGYWHLNKSGLYWVLENTSSKLIFPDSKTGTTISAMLEPLDIHNHIHITVNKESAVVSIALVRLRLDFYWSPGSFSIHSCQYTGKIIDPNQRIGTLAGLVSKLVLRGEHDAADRTTLIPEGTIEYTKFLDHVIVTIDPNTTTRIHDYHFDELLLRLEDNGTFQSKLLLCYLHALTSHFLVDRATGLTGTEAALKILKSAAVSSFGMLNDENVELLSLIAKLTPSRNYNPASTKSTQQLTWDDKLPCLSQHGEFFFQVDRLFLQAQKNSLLYPSDLRIELPKLKSVQSDLLMRDNIRSSTYRTDGFGGEKFTREFDKMYTGREALDPNRGQRCANIITMILREQVALVVEMQHLQKSLHFKHLKNCRIRGPNPLEPTSLDFTTEWLGLPSRFLPRMWCSLHESFSASPKRFGKFAVIMFLSTLAFADGADMDIVQALGAMYTEPTLGSIAVPQLAESDLSQGHKPDLSEIENIVRGNVRLFNDCPERNLPQRPGETWDECYTRKTIQFRENQTIAVKTFAGSIHAQWPCEKPTKPNTQNAHTYIKTEAVMGVFQVKFRAWHGNHLFYQYTQNIADIVGGMRVVNVPTTSKQPTRSPEKRENESNGCFGTREIFALPPPLPANLTSREHGAFYWPRKPVLGIPFEDSNIRKPPREDDGLNLLCDNLEQGAASPCEKKYVADLRDSRNSLGCGQRRVRIMTEELEGDLGNILRNYFRACQRYVQALASVLKSVVESGNEIGWAIDHLPRITPTFWLQQLHRDRYDQLSPEWKKGMVAFGLAITELHRARRLLNTFDKDPSSLPQELTHEGHENWNPVDFPEILLLEVEGGFLVRKVQEDIAKYMRDPPGGRNAVLQLNCGEGKSSVIVPMVAAALSDKKSLVRVLVGRPQSKQMLHTLITTLGGLLGRQIFHMPFTRSLKLTASEADTIGEIFQECMRKRGILLVQPENILSFKLMGIECLISGKDDLAKSLLRTQDFFDSFSRDIVDEADENFSVKFELCYTMGTQRPVDLSPERWKITQVLLHLVKEYAPQISTILPTSIEVLQLEKEKYPRVRLLRKDAEDMLLDLIAKRVCENIFPFLPVGRLPPAIREAVFRYIRMLEPSDQDIKIVEDSNFFNESTKGPLLLVRGLIAGGILRFALTSKRWKVNYGLDFTRSPATKLAVPYRSKDAPSARSEFSHPDVVIALTSLSYYYGGLNDEDLFNAFAYLLRSDQSDIEYGLWVQDADRLPEAFRHLSNINTEDRHQCMTEVFPSLRYSRATIDYFLSRVIFAKEIREFPSKLSASGWDLGAVKANPTTGFSGTNDSRHLLPLSVHHLDLDAQKGTNAMVLQQCILQPNASEPQNAVELIKHRIGSDGAVSDGEHLLSTLDSLTPPVQVILDVGAQILELDNHQVAQKWMAMTSNDTAQAVLFFNDDEELTVLDRTGREEALQVSPFLKRLDECLVYLDEAHTRGIDLRLPKNYRAAVTLGASLTKDRLVQACMRMRKLGKGQSVVFCIPEEIQGKILECTSKAAPTDINVSDVLAWAIKETCGDLSRCMPLWASQGQRYEKHKNLLRGIATTKEEAESFLEDEAQTLESRYRPSSQSSDAKIRTLGETNENLQMITQRCREFGTTTSRSATFQEEQERELAPEVEEERQIERPAPAEPEQHTLDNDLKRLLDEGIFAKNSRTFIPAFQAVKDVSAAKSFDVDQFPTGLLVTEDYIRNVKRPARLPSKSFVSDSYHKPIQWILSVVTSRSSSRAKTQANLKKADALVIISPFEADQLLEQIRASSYVTLHVYAPRSNKTYEPLDDLDLYTIGRPFNPDLPRDLINQLNLFAGQLYFRSYDEYLETCKFLGLASAATLDGQTVQSDGFIVPPSGTWKFRDSPVRFLKDLVVNVRRGGEGVDKTHLGRMLEGEILQEKEFA